jgi:hypothetical protein
MHELVYERGYAFLVSLSIAILDNNVSLVRIPQFSETLAECLDQGSRGRSGVV